MALLVGPAAHHPARGLGGRRLHPGAHRGLRGVPQGARVLHAGEGRGADRRRGRRPRGRGAALRHRRASARSTTAWASPSTATASTTSRPASTSQLITGNIGVEGGGVNPLRGQNNVQGACDMGGLPNVFTGYQPVTNPTAVEKFSKYWNAPLSDKVGMTLTQMIPACGEKIRALYILGENPMVSDPNLHHVEESLREARLPGGPGHLPDRDRPARRRGAARRHLRREAGHDLQHRAPRPALAARPSSRTGNVRQDYEIIADLAARFGHEFPRTPEGLFQEIRDLTPSYAGPDLRPDPRGRASSGRAPTRTTPARASCTPASSPAAWRCSRRSPTGRRPRSPTPSSTWCSAPAGSTSTSTPAA